ncbi:MAG: respiratory nitrate reductase subunit beta [Hyphomicrobiales bacterium]|nr:MAG: respiratory nitrate reductase subunit beta [Hyphomicrobiales bacterium]
MSTSKRQIVFGADLNKCIGCQNCTVACKKAWTRNEGQDYMYWRNVETAPGLGYPKNWAKNGGGFVDGQVQKATAGRSLADYGVPFAFEYHDRLFEGKGKHVKPSPVARWAPNWEDDQGSGEFPNNFFFYVPRMCNHCDNPACLIACPNDAIYKRSEDGLVVINTDLCKGAQDCVAACPYAKSYFNQKTTKANKCFGCYPRIEKGIAPACVAQCNGRAMHVGFLDDPMSSVHKLVSQWKVALPLFAYRGTKPNVFCVPPFLGPTVEDMQGALGMESKIPMSLLEELFRGDVGAAIDVLKAERQKKKDTGMSELMDLLIGQRSADMMLNPLA